ncbi:hypothetical protein BDF20DRAFT_857022 [Mycotypha africana]|uniref:uncharacterized protein n=1 Tax=Mycotypha africana TaxID=64632 RepID=UPI0023012955|nr:uncharacterized protein BDF20DRAFT_857022 [Mycotypha africana]KAI8983920.1 hypothetical protein BDF20DRAFT_857022 [Mycotypha africana]
MLLTDPKIINLIVCSLVGPDVPANTYSVAQSEWADSKEEYTLYVSKNTNDRFIPILIAIQDEIDQMAMLNIIEYCKLVYEKVKLLPTVLIISIKDSSDLMGEEFSVDGDSFLMQCESKFWAHKCFLFLPDDPVNLDRVDTHTTAFLTLCHFISSRNKFFSLTLNLDTQSICLACEAITNKEK